MNELTVTLDDYGDVTITTEKLGRTKIEATDRGESVVTVHVGFEDEDENFVELASWEVR